MSGASVFEASQVCPQGVLENFPFPFCLRTKKTDYYSTVHAVDRKIYPDYIPSRTTTDQTNHTDYTNRENMVEDDLRLTLRPHAFALRRDDIITEELNASSTGHFTYHTPSFVQPRLKEASSRMWRNMWGEDGSGKWERVVDPFSSGSVDRHRGGYHKKTTPVPKKALATHVTDVLAELTYANGSIIRSATRRGGKLSVEFLFSGTRRRPFPHVDQEASNETGQILLMDTALPFHAVLFLRPTVGVKDAPLRGGRNTMQQRPVCEDILVATVFEIVKS